MNRDVQKLCSGESGLDRLKISDKYSNTQSLSGSQESVSLYANSILRVKKDAKIKLLINFSRQNFKTLKKNSLASNVSQQTTRSEKILSGLTGIPSYFKRKGLSVLQGNNKVNVSQNLCVNPSGKNDQLIVLSKFAKND